MEEKEKQETVEAGFLEDDAEWDRFSAEYEKLQDSDEPKAEEAEVEAAPQKEEPCVDCGKDEEAPAKDAPKGKPIATLKVQGKEVPVYTQEELLEYAQKGVDYTKKTQAHSEDRKKFESEYVTKVEEMKALAQKLESAYGQRGPAPPAAPPVTMETLKKEAYVRYGIDEEYASAEQKAMVDDMVQTRAALLQLAKNNKGLETWVQQGMIRESAQKIGEAAKAAREQYPINEVIDPETGENKTANQVIALFKEKTLNPANKNRPFPEMAAEAVKDIHEMQIKGRDSAPDFSGMTREEFKAKFPDLYKRIVEPEKNEAVAEHEAEKANHPPAVSSQRRDVEPSKQKKGTVSDDFGDILDKAFSIPEIRDSFGG